jgi:hypothetical protein
MEQHAIHLVGSIPLGTTSAVFTALGEIIGARAKRYPDGETNGRERFIRWQERVVADNPLFEPADTGGGASYRRGAYRLAPHVRDGEITFDTLGYADTARESCAEFARLQAAGVIPPGVRFQVSLPTPTTFVSAFFEKADRPRIEPAYESAMKREVEAICRAAPASELAIQWDMPYETFGHDGAWELHYENDIEESSRRIARLSKEIPAAVDVGVHLCYGDAGHQHILEPKTLGTCVTMANALACVLPRRLAWVHMPVPRDRCDDDYFRPLEALELNEGTELYLGLVHYTDGLEGARRRISAAARHGREFGVAAECGFGRRDPRTIPDLLRLHIAAGNVEQNGGPAP